jgi:hypothetical protein
MDRISNTGTLDQYARNLRTGGWLVALDLSWQSGERKDVWVNPERLGLPADAPAEQVLEKAGNGDLHVPDPQTIAPVRGTKLAALDLPAVIDPWQITEQDQAARRAARAMSKEQIARKILSHPDAAKPLRPEPGRWYGLLRPDGQLLLMLARPVRDGKLFLQITPAGTVDLKRMQPSPSTGPAAPAGPVTRGTGGQEGGRSD